MPAASTSASSISSSQLHEWFDATVARWPDAIALDVPPGAGRSARQQLTYTELDRLANRVRRFVREPRSVDARTTTDQNEQPVVAILLPRTTPLAYAAPLAALREGAAYTCLDASQPDDRIAAILDDSGARVLLTDDAGAVRAQRLTRWTGHVVDLTAEELPGRGLGAGGWGPEHARFADSHPLGGRSVTRASHRDGVPPQADPPTRVSPDALAYVIYTSGTTGRPKGVMVEHRGISNLVASDLAEFGLGPGQRVGQSSSHAYDSSVEEVWLAFASGASLVVIDDEAVRGGPDLVAWLARERINVFCPPPTLLRSTGCAEPWTALPELTLLYVGGEALPQDLADAWARGRRMVNGYGPTESSVTALRAEVVPGRPVTVGWPVPGVRAWVVDPDTLEPIDDAAPGELCLGGAGLARGYHGHPELTASKFVEHPTLGRLYRTGDLASRDPGLGFSYLGRIDSQVKIRGHRVELGEIEARLSEHPAVRAAICRLQDEGPRQLLVAFLVAEDPSAPPDIGEVTDHARRCLPAHMVPAAFGVVDALPTNLAGKLDRSRLPRLDTRDTASGSAESQGDDLERFVARAVQDVLGLVRPCGLHEDFFMALGGESLSAARLITALRDDPRTSALAVRDVYESPTVAGLAALARGRQRVEAPGPRQRGAGARRNRPFAAVVQVAWMYAGCALAGGAAFALLDGLVLPLVAQVGLPWLTALAPLLAGAALALYVPVALVIAVIVKRVLVGTYREGRWPVWGGFYLRHWVVLRTLRLVPWRLLEGTEFQVLALRALGARIGRRVHIHRGVDLLHGGWDLLDLGDDVTISQDAALQLSHLEDGALVLGPVSLGAGATLDVHASVSPGCRLGAGAYLTAWSWLPAGAHVPANERWEGIPAQPRGPAPVPVGEHAAQLSPLGYSLAFAAARIGVGACLAVLTAATLGMVATLAGLDTRLLVSALVAPAWTWTPFAQASLLAMSVVPTWLLALAVLARLVSPPPRAAIARWSLDYVRVWISTGMLRAAGEWLSGTLMWPGWLRLAGMRIGADCEISTIIDVVASHVTIGGGSFFADGIYLGSPRVHRGTVALAPTRIGSGTFFGNHVIVPAGQRLPDDILLGVCTVADDTVIRPGTSWFGHPPFELPRRELVEEDRSLTHDPSLARYVNRWIWELARIVLPVVPVCALLAWFKALHLARTSGAWTGVAFLGVAVPVVTFSIAGALCLLVLAMKWGLLGRVRPGRHPLWSCWCSRWDFLYMAWGFWARRVLAAFEGTPVLPWYVRAMGARVGADTVLGSGFAQVVDPDMLHIEDGATVDCLFQAHTFEDRVLKIDRVFIRREATVAAGSVVLYGADIGQQAHVASHSVVMKRERLLPGRSYVGSPTRVLEGA